MITLIGECKNCGEIYGKKVIGTLESIYNDERTHKCEREGEGMKTYKITLEVDYIIKSTSLSEAMSFALEDSEHPLVGGIDIGYCDDVRAISGAIESEAKV